MRIPYKLFSLAGAIATQTITGNLAVKEDKLQNEDTEICTRRGLQLTTIPEQCLGPPPLKSRFEVWLYQ